MQNLHIVRKLTPAHQCRRHYWREPRWQLQHSASHSPGYQAVFSSAEADRRNCRSRNRSDVVPVSQPGNNSFTITYVVRNIHVYKGDYSPRLDCRPPSPQVEMPQTLWCNCRTNKTPDLRLPSQLKTYLHPVAPYDQYHITLGYIIFGWQHGSVVRTSSLADGLSLIYTWSMADMWPHRGKSVRYGSTNQANSAFHPFGVSKWVAIHVITSATRVETIKRHTWAACGCWPQGQSPASAGFSLRPMDCAPALSVTQSAAAAAVAACGII